MLPSGMTPPPGAAMVSEDDFAQVGLPPDAVEELQRRSDGAGIPLTQQQLRKEDFVNSDCCIVYPAYIDKDCTVKMGRRITTAECCERPVAVEMAEALQMLGMQVFVEPRAAYPRDSTKRTGRVRVRYKRDGAPLNSELSSKKALCRKIAECVPQTELRKRRLAWMAKYKEKLEAAKAKKGGTKGAVGASTTGSKASDAKKKPKKKKRR